MEQESNDLKNLFQIKTTEIGDKFQFECGQGFDLSMIAFGISAFIRVLVRDKIIDDSHTFVGAIIANLTNPNYDEYIEEVEESDDKNS